MPASTYPSSPTWRPERAERAHDRICCWECGQPASERQLRSYQRTCGARLCASCAAWALSIFRTKTNHGGQA